jgi:hypothetical protein
MKKLALLTVMFIFGAEALAQITPPPGPSRPGRPIVRPNPPNPGRPIVRPPVTRPPHRWGRTNPPPRYNERGRFFEYDGRQFINVPDTCNANYVRFEVHGDNLIINSLEVIFGNGETQQLAFRGGVYRPQHPQQWIDLKGSNRCIMGFFLDAYSEGDMDLQGSYIALYASVNEGWRSTNVFLENVYIADWNSHRGFVRPVRPVVPPPVPPPAPPRPPVTPPNPPAVAPTLRIVALDQWQRVEKFSHLVNFSVNQSFVTEIRVRARNNNIAIKSAAYRDSYTGRTHEIPALRGVTIPRDGFFTARISFPGTAMVQTVTIEAVSDLFGSRADMNLEIGLAR